MQKTQDTRKTRSKAQGAHKAQEDQINYAEYMRSVILGALVGLIICILILLIASFLLAGGRIPESMMPQIVMAAALLGAFTGSFISVKSVKSKALLTGLLCGVSLYLFIVLIGLIFDMNYGSPGNGLGIIISVLLGSLAGGILGAGGKGKTKRR